MDMETLCTAKNLSTYVGMGAICTDKTLFKYGHGDTLHYQKAHHTRAWRHFALPKRPRYVGMQTFCIHPTIFVYGHGDILHYQKDFSCIAMGTLCPTKKLPKFGHGDSLDCKSTLHKCA